MAVRRIVNDRYWYQVRLEKYYSTNPVNPWWNVCFWSLDMGCRNNSV